jgi:2-dehydro-3-deoxyphosphogluconate aldolase/(4S)-4-hydroxy-2-oxoglutarate aldolase
MKKHEKLSLIRETGLIAILRANSSDQLIAAAEALRAGGVRAIEVTMTTPGALRVIEEASRRFGDEVLFGAGTVLDVETARAAILAGAAFLVTPTFSRKVIRLCRRYSVPVLPGCYTPTEMLDAWEAGADMIKFFPASNGGPELLVTLENAAEFIRKGAVALGVGGELVNQKLLDARDFAEITRRALAFGEQINAT